MNNRQKLAYYDKLFTSGNNLVPRAALDWARANNVRYNNITADDYFELLLVMSGTSKNNLTPRQFRDFKDVLWQDVEYSKELLKVGQVLRLKNKRFTGNQYVITRLTGKGFDVHNRRQPQYRFEDLDYSSIDKILVFNL